MRKIRSFRIRTLWEIKRDGVMTTIVLKQPLVPAAFLAAFIYYLLVQTGIMAMAVTTLGGILLVSYLWARSMALNISAERRLRYTAFQVGDEFEEHITLNNRSSLPVLWAEFTDHSNIPGYTVSSVRSAGGNSAIEWRARTLCEQRGRFLLGPWELSVGEVFGIFQVNQRYLDRKEIIVYPPLAPLPPELLPHTSSVGSHRQLHQALAAETIHANTTRPYVSGDPLRRLHWRTSARKNDLFVKVFEPEASSNVWLIPDFDAAAHVGQGSDSSVETLVILVASLASQLLEDRLSVGVFASAGEPCVVLPRTGRAHLWQILRALAPLQTIPDQPLIQTLTQARTVVDRSDLLIVLTPSLDLDWALHFNAIFSRHSSGGGRQHAKAILLDPASFAASDVPSGRIPSQQILGEMTSLGIHTTLLSKEDIRPVLGTFGTLRRWEFKTLGTGRIHVRQAPRQAETP
jgi:uncharacterized protein (DUF58 family)